MKLTLICSFHSFLSMEEEKNLKKIAKEGREDLSHFFNVGPNGVLYRKRHKIKAFAIADAYIELNLNNPKMYWHTAKTGIYIILEHKQ